MAQQRHNVRQNEICFQKITFFLSNFLLNIRVLLVFITSMRSNAQDK